MNESLSKADLHFHTWYSTDSFISPKKAVNMAVKKGFALLAITDHDTILGAQKAKEYAKKNNLPIEIVIGEEIYTNGGHVIGLFLQSRIPSFQPLKETLMQIKDQGGMTVIPHMKFEQDPLGEYFYRYQVSSVELANDDELLGMIDAIEVENFSLIEPQFLEKTRFINEHLLKKAEVGTSDCHIAMNFGHAYTLFLGKTAQDFKRAIQEKKTQACCGKQKNLIQQIAGFGPVIKLPIHLGLQHLYRFTATIAENTKNLLKGRRRKMQN